MGRYTLPGESAEYRELREELAREEIALVQQRERVAALRRRLPQTSPPAPDYLFHEGPRSLAGGDTPVHDVRLSELMDEGDGRPVVLLQFMHGGAQRSPCPMCSLWADGYNGIVRHLEQRITFAVVVAGDLDGFRGYARERGWQNLRLLSSEGSDLKPSLGFEERDGSQWPGVSVFARGDDGAMRHFYSTGARLSDDAFRGMDLLSPFWSFLDLTPDGRGDFMPQRSYD